MLSIPKRKLLIIASERISEWIDKGEVISRYFNPGTVFDEVHILILNDDKPNPEALKTLVGNVPFFVYNLPEPPHNFRNTLGWQPFLMKKWINQVVDFAVKLSPNIIRCYGAHLNSLIASKIKEKHNIPYIVSLHINPNVNTRASATCFKNKIIYNFLKRIEKIGLRGANLVMPVYKPIIPYLKDIGVDKYRVCYNMSNSENIRIKDDYTLSNPVKAICIGRLFHEKDPIHLIQAIATFSNIELTILGTGPLLPKLKTYVSDNKLESKIKFIDAISNSELCRQLPTFDFVALHTEHFEFSKVMIESFLSAVPVLLNYRKTGDQVPELTESNCLRVDNTIEGYSKGIERLVTDEELRKSLGRNALESAKQFCSSEKAEQTFVNIYEEYMLA